MLSLRPSPRLPDLWTEYDAAQAAYDAAIADIDAERSRREGTDDPMLPGEARSRENTVRIVCDDVQAEIVARYTAAMEALDDEAATTATVIASAQSFIIGTASSTNRAQIGANLFNDIPWSTGKPSGSMRSRSPPGPLQFSIPRLQLLSRSMNSSRSMGTYVTIPSLLRRCPNSSHRHN